MKTTIILLISILSVLNAYPYIFNNKSPVLKTEVSDLPDIIISQKDEIFSYLKNTSYEQFNITDNYTIVDMAVGDLNNDKKDDFTVVVQQENTKLRQIYVFEQSNDGNYNLTHINKNLVSDGGTCDSFNGISIKDNILSVEEYGGTSVTWNYIYNFGYENQDFILKEYIFINYDSTFDYGKKYTYDFQKLYCSFNMFRGFIIRKNRIMFETPIENKKFYFDTFNNSDLPNNDFNIPYIYSYVHSRSSLKISAQEALDTIKNLYYNDMEKVYISWTKKTKKNYSQALGYEPPDYYYKDENGILKYYEFNDYDQNPTHIISYENKKTNYNEKSSSKSYHLSDNTGEISN